MESKVVWTGLQQNVKNMLSFNLEDCVNSEFSARPGELTTFSVSSPENRSSVLDRSFQLQAALTKFLRSCA